VALDTATTASAISDPTPELEEQPQVSIAKICSAFDTTHPTFDNPWAPVANT
jgi:hypothetical protein